MPKDGVCLLSHPPGSLIPPTELYTPSEDKFVLPLAFDPYAM